MSKIIFDDPCIMQQVTTDKVVFGNCEPPPYLVDASNSKRWRCNHVPSLSRFLVGSYLHFQHNQGNTRLDS